MIFTILSTAALGGIAGYGYLKSNSSTNNESEKIIKILNNSGLRIKDAATKRTETIRILKKCDIKDGTEYVFQLPLGIGQKDVLERKHLLEDGLNTKSKTMDFHLKDVLDIKWNRKPWKQIMELFKKKKAHKKEIEISYDGTLKIRVYNEQLTKELIWDESMLTSGTWKICLGGDRHERIYHDFDERKHLIIAGVPGSGKSVIMKLIITSLMLQNPNDVSFSLIDLKGGPAFARFKDCMQVRVGHLGINMEESLRILKEVQEDMENVYQKILVPNDYEDVTEAGIKKRHFIVIDEAADIVDFPEAVDILTDIVRKGRGSGHYVIYSTQYPSAQAIPMQIKRNIPSRISYVLDSATASTTVLDQSGAENLPEIPGRGIYKGSVKQSIFQTAFIDNQTIKEKITPFVIIQPRKDDQSDKVSSETTENRRYSLIVEENGLSDQGTDSSYPQSKRRQKRK
ncbi:FtsK/SpoIIIE domain-containing protein [Bacillus sp. FJAT-49736]|uniref:FtsK/SpoIIIE domain-containing protein n=1 Tax=Bacillus sp. FJAT-49736 TaxID=2833582 RepID=UPI001BC962A5|nr:FtsK/SpoIIIE domain-containing protein [Bacillus sp. FJAT-49736]MBS4172147.1 cell division protein FtsK [Bacillus sp. FJAT-49736]